VELHTGSFARAWADERAREAELAKLIEGMEVGISLGLQINAGHGINYQNVEGARKLTQVTEFNIGHSIISRSIKYGLAEAVSTMRQRLNS
jgi:pyridoxine 5-phosphate synthase